MNKMKKMIFASMMALALLTTVSGCTEAQQVSQNVSQQADNFNVLRQLTVLDTRTNKPMFEMVGVFSINVDNPNNQLEVTVETSNGVYKKHIIGLNRDTMYVVEDLGGAKVSKYHYEVNFLPQEIVPYKITSND